MAKKYIYYVLLFLILFLIGCDNINDKKIEELKLRDDVPTEMFIDDFDLSFIKFYAIQSDGTKKTITLTEKMLSDDDLLKLQTLGTHTITINYSSLQISYTISLVECSDPVKYLTVVFKDYDGTVLKTEEVIFGRSATKPDDPHRDGYLFIGWDCDFLEVTEDLIVNAVYLEFTVYKENAINIITDLYNEKYFLVNGASEILDKYIELINQCVYDYEVDSNVELCKKELERLDTDEKKELLTIEEVKKAADEAGTSGALVTFVGTVVGFDSMGYAQVGDSTGLIYVRAKHDLLIKDANVKIKGYTTIYQGSSSAYHEYTRQIKADDIEITAYDGLISNIKEAVVLDSSELIENKNYKDTTIHGNLITISGIVEVGSSKYSYYLNDEQGNHIVAIHHYSNNFERFNSLNGALVTLTGVVYRYYTTENIWTLQLIGLSEELVVSSQDESEIVNFVMINDTHGAFIDDAGVPGIGRVSSVIDELSLLNGDYIKIANGDIFQGSYVSNVLYGRPLIDALNKIEFDAFVLGNHEFDWGLEKIANYKDGNLANGEANFPFLGANVIDKKTNEIVDWLEPYVIINYGDYKVGIIGVIGETQESSILTENVTGYDFTDASDAIEKYAVELRIKEKCDIVVVASHDYDEYTNYEIANFDSDARIDAIFCAHTHQKISTNLTRNDGYKIPVVQNYDKNETIAEVVLKMSNTDEVSGYYTNFYSPSNYNVDSDLNDVISLYQNEINEGNRVLGTTSYTIDKATLGSYATDAMLTEYSADVAIINTGGVRETIDSGDITVSDVFNVFPFNNEIILVELTGSALISLYNENSNYLYFNEEFSIYLINSSSTYEVAVIDYVFTSPYYTQFEGAEYTDTDVVMRDIFIEYIDNLY